MRTRGALLVYFRIKAKIYQLLRAGAFRNPARMEALRRLQKLWVLFDFTFRAWNDQVTASAAAAALAEIAE